MATALYKQVVTDGLVFYIDAGNIKSYPATGSTWVDFSRNEFTGNFINGPIFSNDGGGVIELDGVNDYIEIPHGGVLSFSASDFTVSVWQKVISVGGYHGIVTNDNASDDAWKIYHDTGHIRYTARCNYGTLVFDPYTIGKFHNYTFTVTGTSLRTYTDTILNNQVATTISPVAENNIALGKYRYGDTNLYANQQIGTVMLYNRALSQDEITFNYNALKNRFI